MIDYSVYSKLASEQNFNLLASNVGTLFYQLDVTAGETYQFQVTARNAVGESAFSETVEILAAKPPDAPI